MLTTRARKLALPAALLGLAVAAPAQAQGPPIFTIAGSGPLAGALNCDRGGFGGDRRPATDALIFCPSDMAVTQGGNLLIVDTGNRRIRRVSRGIITTVAGSGRRGSGGDGGPATRASLDTPSGIALLPDGSFVFTDAGNDRVRRVSRDGIITTVAGTGQRGFGGDGGPATQARLDTPTGIVAAADGGFFFADSENDRVRAVSPSGLISTVAGTGSRGLRGDGGPALAAQLAFPSGLDATEDGSLLIADALNNRVRFVARDGTIRTVAGSGPIGVPERPNFGGDGGPATSARLNAPVDVAGTTDGGFLIADSANNRIRQVSPGGTIRTVAGSGGVDPRRANAAFGGDGGLAVRARLGTPGGVAAEGNGGFLIADTLNNRIRFVPGQRTEALAVALFPALSRGPTFRLGYRTTLNASLTLQVFLGRRLVTTARARAGQRLVLRRVLRPGRYTFKLTARRPTSIATSRATVIITRTRARGASIAGTSSGGAPPGAGYVAGTSSKVVISRNSP